MVANFIPGDRFFRVFSVGRMKGHSEVQVACMDCGFQRYPRKDCFLARHIDVRLIHRP